MKPLQLSKPHLIVMVGIPGAGKSFFAEHFSETFNAPYVSDDRIRRELFNQPTRSTDEETIIARMSTHLLDELLKTQRSIVFEGATGARTQRDEIARKAKAAGYETLLVWVQTESVSAKNRATKPAKDRAPYTADQFDHDVRHFSAPHVSEKATVVSGKHTYASQLKIVLKRLVEPRPERPPTSRPIEGRHIAVR